MDPLLRFAWFLAIAGPPLGLFLWFRLRAVRRARLGWRIAAGLYLLFYGLGLYASLIEPETLVVRHVAVESAAWSGAPLKIGVISDTHVGAAHGRVSRVRDLVARMNAEHPDIVVLLGDYAGRHERAQRRSGPQRAEVIEGVKAFAGLRAPLGVYAVLGNHDWWYGADDLQAALAGAHAIVLANSSVAVSRPAGDFWVAGLEDRWSQRADPSPARAIAAVPAGRPVILLSHWPDPFTHTPDRVALTLAGHTHCGQVNLPVFGRLVAASRAARRWPCGLYDVDGRKLFVSAGVGTSILPVRFRAPPEIDVITLRRRTDLPQDGHVPFIPGSGAP